MTDQVIHGSIEMNQLSIRFEFTAVYGLHIVMDRKALWDELRYIHRTCEGSWIAMGDYNAVASNDDRPVGIPVTEVKIADFRDFLFDTGTTELKQVGREFTWTNSHTFSIIDRALVNTTWMLHMNQREVGVMDPLFSDHSPLCLDFFEQKPHIARPFKFLNCLADHVNFLRIVREAWNESTQGYGMHGVWKSLKIVKRRLKQLNTQEYGNCKEKINFARRLVELHQCMRNAQQSDLYEQEKVLKQELKKWNCVEESILKQKSRVSWLKLGDANNSYFFASMKSRQAQNAIQKLVSRSGRIIQKQEDIEQKLMSFYKDLLGTSSNHLYQLFIQLQLEMDLGCPGNNNINLFAELL